MLSNNGLTRIAAGVVVGIRPFGLSRVCSACCAAWRPALQRRWTCPGNGVGDGVVAGSKSNARVEFGPGIRVFFAVVVLQSIFFLT